jgi:hypothetical protein
MAGIAEAREQLFKTLDNSGGRAVETEPLPGREESVTDTDTDDGGTPDVEASAPDTGETTETPESTQEVGDLSQKQVEDILDLSSGNRKLKVDGKVYTVDELKKMMLRHDDYTKKTQALAETRKKTEADQKKAEAEGKYASNFAADIERVLANPNLESDFMQIYPKKYQIAYQRIKNARTGISQGQGEQGQTFTRDPAMQDVLRTLQDWEQKMSSFEEKVLQAETEKEEARLNAVFSTLQTKYDLGDESANANLHDLVIARAQALDRDPTQEDLETLYKNGYEVWNRAVKSGGSKAFKDQKEANKKASDVATGGGIATGAPVVNKTFKDARKAMTAALERMGRG